ncbi:uncharacterized protein LOC114315591 [Camellia sinensis]|uniref:uncharacterized protein LOC114315591 n=1 Tax=Camellia sinensis TaxID=4442 RepID=UPI0010359BAC|nr:uncharacterized protein LOC114315591 [Camellia sinensis]
MVSTIVKLIILCLLNTPHLVRLTALIVYVDDIVLTGDDVEEVARLKEYLVNEFEIKDLSSLKYFLGNEVARSKDGIFICQRQYVLDLLKETEMLGSKACDTPLELGLKRSEAQRGEPIDGEIPETISMVSQFMHAPRATHLEAVMRILRYLKSSPGKGLYFSKYGYLSVEAYTDADWIGLITDRRSTSGYCTFVGGNLVIWRSKK